jgi:UDP-glucose 4-epimerase
MSEYIIRSKLDNYLIFRLFNIVGPGQNHNTGMVLPNFIFNAINNLNIDIYNSGSQIRTFCYINDAISMMNNILESDIKNEIFNIGSDLNIITIKNLANLVKKTLSSNSKIVYTNYKLDENLIKNKRYEDINIRVPNINKYNSLINKKINYKDLIYIIKKIEEIGDF